MKNRGEPGQVSGDWDCVLLPGGGPGAAALSASQEVGKLLRQQEEAGRMIAAICAAPTALASHRQDSQILLQFTASLLQYSDSVFSHYSYSVSLSVSEFTCSKNVVRVLTSGSRVGVGKAVTSYPAQPFKEALAEYQYKEDEVVVDGNIVTSRGPGTSFQFALEIVKILVSEQKMKEVAGAMLVTC